MPLFLSTVRLMAVASGGHHLVSIPLFTVFASPGSGFYVRLTGKYYLAQLCLWVDGVFASILLST